jgi:hypothetical protein
MPVAIGDTAFVFNEDSIAVFHAPNAHTDGDVIVHFTKSFHDKENAKKQYALDFWLKSDGGRRRLESAALLDMICAVNASEGAA